MDKQNIKTIMFSGGGSGGPVVPLLAVAEELFRESVEIGNVKLNLVFVGTKRGPEKEMVSSYNQETGPMEFVPLISGKWRRYLSIHNLLDIFKIVAAFIQSFSILSRYQPQIIISAGAFVSVPLVWAAAIKKIPILIHQQDLRPGLANRLMAPFARTITVVFDKSLIDYGPRAVLAGNPIRRSLETADEQLIKKLKNDFKLDNSIPLVLFFGGGLGATGINRLVFKASSELARHYQLIHLTGKGKLPDNPELLKMQHYHILEMMDNRTLSTLISIADLVVTRAGLSTLTELSYWRKPAILIPMPQSHQQDNSAYFANLKAAINIDQDSLTPEKLTQAVKDILNDPVLKRELSNNIGKAIKRDAAVTISSIITEIISPL